MPTKLLLLLAALACSRPSESAPVPGARDVIVSSDSSVLAAAAALGEGRAWRATELLAPALSDSARRSPEALLLGARAAAAWNGWSEVQRLLTRAPWLDTLHGGEGRVLLARAALERGERESAVEHARLAVQSARGSRERGARLVLLARSYDRLDQRDSARAEYERAASLIPEASDWLRLRAAGVTDDSTTRAASFAALRSELARSRVRWTEALARERSGDTGGAARVYESLGARVAAVRLRLAGSPDSAGRLAARRELLAIVERRAGDARAAIELLDAHFAPLTPAEELAVARAAGSTSRAAQAFSRALGAGVGTTRDRFDYATTLSRLGRDRDAVSQFARIATGPLAGRAAYQRARSLLRSGQGAAAITALQRVAHAHAPDTAAAAPALFLLGDLASDSGNDTEARTRYRELVRRYPTSDFTPRARFRAALIALVAGDARTAARELDTLATLHPRASDALAAIYWSGRAWSAAGDTAAARERWRRIGEREPLSYYAMLAARRLGSAPWAPAASASIDPAVAAVDSAMAHAALLEELGLTMEAGWEYDRIASSADSSPERALAVARAFHDRGMPWRATALATRALSRGAPRDARTYRLLYPVAPEEVLLAESRAHGLDHALVAALIRQESGFNPRATSRVGAAGLMQLMPDVGRQIARSLDFPVWDRALLYQGDVNIRLGTMHLAALLKQYDDVTHALAAYNAGASRVTRWRRKAGTDDPELFVERIPFVETRDYVRIVLRNREMYRALYGW
jgi:soluble lytic murein transglycosylase